MLVSLNDTLSVNPAHVISVTVDPVGLDPNDAVVNVCLVNSKTRLVAGHMPLEKAKARAKEAVELLNNAK